MLKRSGWKMLYLIVLEPQRVERHLRAWGVSAGVVQSGDHVAGEVQCAQSLQWRQLLVRNAAQLVVRQRQSCQARRSCTEHVSV